MTSGATLAGAPILIKLHLLCCIRYLIASRIPPGQAAYTEKCLAMDRLGPPRVWSGSNLDPESVQHGTQTGPKRLPEHTPPLGGNWAAQFRSGFEKKKHARNVSHSNILGKPSILSRTCSKKRGPPPDPPLGPWGVP